MQQMTPTLKEQGVTGTGTTVPMIVPSPSSRQLYFPSSQAAMLKYPFFRPFLIATLWNIPSLNGSDIMPHLAAKWKEMDEEARKPYAALSEQDSARYRREMTVYNEQQAKLVSQPLQGRAHHCTLAALAAKSVALFPCRTFRRLRRKLRQSTLGFAAMAALHHPAHGCRQHTCCFAM